MKKLWLFLVLFILMFSIVYAERGSGNNDSNEESEDETNNENTPECNIDTDCDRNEICINEECEDKENETEDSNEESEDVNDELRNESINRARWVKECVDDSALRNINDVMFKIKRAEAVGEEAKVLELKKRIEELNTKIREKANKCKQLRTLNQGAVISAAVKYENGSASEVVDYYKLKLSEISSEANETTRLKMLRDLRESIDDEIKNIMERTRAIRSEDMKELVQKIEIKKDKIRADEVEIDSENRSIITEINGKEVEIKVRNGQVKIIVNNVEADTSAISVENNTLYYEGVAIKTLPSDALSRYKITAKEIVLEQEGNKVVYKVKYESRKKILGLFKANAVREASIDSVDGNKLSDKGPWWNALATDDKSANVKDSTEDLENERVDTESTR